MSNQDPEFFDQVPTRPPITMRRLRRPREKLSWLLSKMVFGNPVWISILSLVYISVGQLGLSLLFGVFAGSLMLGKSIFLLCEWKYAQHSDLFRQRFWAILARKILTPFFSAICCLVLHSFFGIENGPQSFFYEAYLVGLVLVCLFLSLGSYYFHISD